MTKNIEEKTIKEKKEENNKSLVLRSPICSVLGHIDHGKSSILDSIRGTTIINKEAGAITQAIGASIIPLDVIKKISGKLFKQLKIEVEIPGLLFIDTPGHAAFTNMRKRGGNLADIAILVVDINEGLMPQTLEAVDILKQYKTPFIIAANKIDLVQGFDENIFKQKLKDKKFISFKELLEVQNENYKNNLDIKLYELIGKLQELSFDAERYDRIKNFTKQVTIVPVSAKKNIGMNELLMMLIGLTQKFLRKKLYVNIEEPGRGVVLEVKEDKGLGKTLDVILYDGSIKKNDLFLVPGINGIIKSRVKILLQPKPLEEMRDKKSEFLQVKKAYAATGIKIVASNIDEVIAGMPILTVDNENQENILKLSEELQREIEEVLIEKDNEGVIIKADTLGSLEALKYILEENNIPVKKASIGNVTKKDIVEAYSMKEKNIDYGIVLGFNVKANEEVIFESKNKNVKLILNEVIYKILEDYLKHLEEAKKEKEKEVLKELVKPVKIQILPGYIFRQSNPAIVGVLVDKGVLTTNIQLMKEGKIIGRVKGIQKEKESISEVEEGSKIAVSIEGATVGRNIEENDYLYSYITEEEFRKYKKYKDLLNSSEKIVLKEIAEIMRRKNPVWGV